MALKNITKNGRPVVLDLFCGCGGLSCGFAQEGFNVIAGIDNWNESLVTFEKNHPGSRGVLMDLSNFNPGELVKFVSKIDVVIGGPPCQGFSISGKRDPDDPRNRLYSSFVKTVGHFKPKAFVLENVPHLVSMAEGRIKNSIIRDFHSLGYDVKYKILNASDYGVPQNRRRVFFVGTIGKNNFEFPEGNFTDPKTKITCLQALSDLPDESISDGFENTVKPASAFQKLMRRRSNKIFNHQVTNHDARTAGIISLVPDGGNYRNLPVQLQKTRKVHIAWTRYNSAKPGFTVDTGHRHHFHYKYNRIPTVREAARLQSFSDDFIFCGSKTSQYKQVGNAVPPLMAGEIARSLLEVLEKNKYV